MTVLGELYSRCTSTARPGVWVWERQVAVGTRPAAVKQVEPGTANAERCRSPRTNAGTVANNDQLDLLAEWMGVGEQVAALTNSVRQVACLDVDVQRC